MGNSQSTDTPKSPNHSSHQSAVPSTSSSSYGDDSRASPHRQQGQPRRPQGQVGKAINPLPQSLVSTAGSASISTSSAHAHASPQRTGNARARSMTASAALPDPSSLNHRPDSRGASSVESKHLQPHRSAPTPGPATAKPDHSPITKTMQSAASKPVDVPVPSNQETSPEADRDNDVSGYSESPYGLPPANYSRPPRLPLPIEEEVHTPGSPIIAAHELILPLDASEVEGALPRKTSVLSSTTVDEDEDVVDNETFAAESSQTLQLRIPTLVEWNGYGDKIFVTGTFCNWEKKVKLHRNKEKPGFSAHVLLPPGTHHLKFLVDGEMETSNDLPTTVDWTNILVNYIEIVAPLPPAAEPIPIPGKTPAGSLPDEPVTRPPSYRPGVSEIEPDLIHAQVHEDGPEVDQPPTQQPSPYSGPVTPIPLQQSQHEVAPPKHKRLPRPKYTNQIPDFLLDLDNYNNPEDERFQNASKVAGHLPQPPTLPSFLGKSILNSATPHKDDASVLVLPNHTVINHLATSSIKSGVLATSGTTRYRQKFLTTIMYKPTSESG